MAKEKVTIDIIQKKRDKTRNYLPEEILTFDMMSEKHKHL